MRQKRTYQILPKNSIRLLLLLLLMVAGLQTRAQIKIGGNVYGGGNEGNVGGNTTVTLRAGDLNKVFGGSRMADIDGWSFVNIDGAHASGYMLINYVYGGNDISGTVGKKIGQTGFDSTAPGELTLKTENHIDNTWDAFVRISTKTTTDANDKVVAADDAKEVYIGQLFAGGNGDYDYTGDLAGKTAPNLDKTYLEILGGSIVYAFGGGNNATVTEKTVICVDNPSKVVNSIKDANNDELLTDARIALMGYNPGYTYPTSDAFQIGSFFGGNNRAAMAIRPTWNLKSGKIRNLYSGGNEGNMTSTEGLLLEIPETSEIKVDNVYGGCRKAHVIPGGDLAYPGQATDLEDYFFPKGYGFSARVLVRGGDINNVYGGNDITGKVYGGNAVGVYTSIRGDIYGGGNGSYPYTDNPELKEDDVYGEIYYDKGSSSVDALNEFRPNAEQVSIRVAGKANKKTVIGGAIYLGGNSATMSTDKANPKVELKIGSYVIAENVFLGNNGANMVDSDVLGKLKTVNSINLASTTKDNNGKTQFDYYMDGCAMTLMPSVVFDDAQKGDPATYIPYSSYIGSFYCGGNVGSMIMNGKIKIDFKHQVIIYNKVVGGCNNANVAAEDGINAAYEGGVLGNPETSTGDKLELNLAGLKIQPKRWKVKRKDNYEIEKDENGNVIFILDANNNPQLEWNTVSAATGKDVAPVTEDSDDSAFNAEKDLNRRLKGGNVYGGCYNSGHVNGNVVLNINETLMERDKLFDLTNEGDILYDNVEGGTYEISKRNTGVILSQQGMDVLGSALNVFGGGYGAASEIWGSTTINLNKGYTFQIFGGGEAGAIGKKDNEGQYVYNKDYSTYINLNGDANLPGVARGTDGDSPNMAECEFIYGGAFEGMIAGDIHINLGNGRIFNSFAGSCNADILGHTETYVGRKKKSDGTYEDGGGFPWIRDHIYGGNDLGGSILGEADFSGRIRNEVKDLVADAYKTQVEKATTYMEYIQGRVRNILGGCFGDYNYSLDEFSVKESADDENYKVANKPYLHNAFINFRPNTNANNSVEKIFGAGEGYPGDRDGDKGQDHSYVLIDIPDNVEKFANTEVFGAGAYNGLGMRYSAAETFAANFDLNEASAIIDLMRGKIGAAYGGSYEEGITRRTVVNVPAKGASKSTIKINNIFGGAYGMKILPPCDVYEANVNYQSGDARVNGAIYGGNNNVRRTLYGKVNISAPVLKENGYSGYVYGAGRGRYTWSEYTEVNLERGASVWEVYGGGELGNVLNAESVQKYLQLYSTQPADMVANEDPDDWGNPDKWVDGTVGGTLKDDFKPGWKKAWMAAWTIDGYYNPVGDFTRYVGNEYTNLLNPLVTVAEMDDRDLSGFSNDQKTRTFQRYNTNVIIKEGATVGNYAYGGGYGDATIPLTGGVYGSSYIALLGGTVGKDIYAAGTTGSVCDIFGAGKPGESNSMGFIASANVYIKGGTARNVYGGGWEGSVGHHVGEINSSTTDDRLGETHVVVGILDGTSHANGIPTIGRNVYGGGEGGAVFGTAYTTINNGYVGYKWSDGYQENIVDETYKDEQGNFIPNTNLETSGNIFGGGYIDNSSVDFTNVKICGGVIRSSVYGGGEIAAIGRGDANEDGSINGIYKAGKTHVYVYDGWVKRNVFGGGKGIDNLGRTGSLHTDGFIFGQTDVNIHGGEIGTEEGVAKGYGNVFGGGDIGCVYSAFEYPDGSLGRGKKSGTRYDNNDEGYYYKSKGGSFTDDNGTTLGTSAEKHMTEDSHVLVEPHCRVKTAGQIGGVDYAVGDYVPTAILNKLQDKTADEWSYLEDDGIIIHNAIFAGGNVSSGSDQVYANATTLYGNATASIHDVYHRDLITIGTGHTGGLYGDGNLTFVDGYRGLNITNYGTDYYHISPDITLDAYNDLTPREAAYYELKYKCVQECTDNEGTTYSVGSTLAQDELIALFAGQTNIVAANGTIYDTYWVKNGVVSRYAGRIMNTIQRADFCGVWGSRMVMKGAQDRVPEIVDYTNYTINRVREVSLNAKISIAGDDPTDTKHYKHGNYFGIYNIVNYLGALTSDVDFNTAVRTTDNRDDAYKTPIVIDESISYAYGSEYATYYNWKKAHANDRNRNNGTSHNQVALASGVYLELTTEEKTGDDLWTKEWGYITGVVELDLINVQSGIGGGFVYAKNVHGVRGPSGKTRVTLTDLNQGAVSNRSYTYSTDDASQSEWQTSGNFVHGTQTIIDDCYDIGGKYKGTDAVPAHYWFIKGQVYVYDQYVSAYTGAPNAYSETVNIPLTITAASHGTMRLLNVQPNLYAYYSSYNSPTQNKKLVGDNKLVINDVTYHLNDPISYWDWNLLNKSTERNLFVKDTYVVIADCKIDNTSYTEGTVLLKSEYDKLIENGKPANVTQKKMVDGVETYVSVDFDFVFRSSNNLGHDTGYILTYNVNNPTVWNKYYSPNSGSSRDGKITLEAYNAMSKNEQAAYTDGPTYTPKVNGFYGQREFKLSDIITKEAYDTYQLAIASPSVSIPANQAVFEPAYVVTSYLETVKKDGTEQRLQEGAKLAQSEYDANKWASMSGSVAAAYVCTSTITLSKTEFIYNGELMTKTKKDELKAQYPTLATDIENLIVPAYYCSTAGNYGGNYYVTGKNYRAIEAFNSMSKADRDKFTFNYDALDLLIDPAYGGTEGQKCQYDGLTYSTDNASKMIYSLEKPVDYTATYNGAPDGDLLVSGKEYTRTEYEALPNEQRHYAPINVSETGTYYVVNSPFIIGETPYAVGTVIEGSTYNSITDGTIRNKITALTFSNTGTYYYCRESYNGTVDVSAAEEVTTNASYTSGTVPVGLVITGEKYGSLPNKQKNFTIHGVAPTETSTLFVSRTSDIFDLSKDKIITVIYEYNYEESDESGLHITPVSERHVVNIHLQFKSGVPSVEDITKPNVVFPGTAVTLRTPDVKPGAYEVTGGGWEIFETVSDAESHTNGVEYSPSSDPLYWYQDGYYVAYYAQTYLGKTYSNHVPLSIANYHDLKKVMDDEHHLHIDYDLRRMKRDSKIYINDYSSSSQNGLDLLKSLVDLTYSKTDAVSTYGAFDTPTNIAGGENLDIIMRTNINHPAAWTSIASGTGECFSGTFHGDGYYIEGLTSSLFGNLCGDVYNLGVAGKFTSAGIADTGKGYVENCWVKSSTTSGFASDVRAVFGKPNAASSIKQIVNCYYPATNTYSTDDSGAHGLANAMPEDAFYNGTVAYDLNGFYLYKRYCDQKLSSTTTGATPYYYYTIGNNELQTGYYTDNKTLCSSGVDGGKYVEDRMIDGDYRYANGTLPDGADGRSYTVKDANNNDVIRYAPIWPDDYLFFGQMLTYGWNESRPHEELPSHLYKSNDRLVEGDQNNRVYRAPAYYGNKTMSVAHFNPNVNLVAYSKPKTPTDQNLKAAYPNLTAIDFYGYNDKANGTSAYKLGLDGSYFYAPLLDEDGLQSIINRDETQNLLVYASTSNAKTYNVLNSYFVDPKFSDYYTASDKYRRVASASTASASVFGHMVLRNDDAFTTDRDHLLVDKQDFNCPIAYTMGAGKRMWYQREPDNYVTITNNDKTIGWEGICLPFAAELVSTPDKGEITHFYGDSKTGHEYWLREYNGGSVSGNEFVGKFNAIAAGSNTKNYTNTYLWDTYYSKDSSKDLNEDTYQQGYYSSPHEYTGYPYNAVGTPYLVGFPGASYYEFDLSGNWTPQNRYQGVTIANPGRQTISFVSKESKTDNAVTIGVSDTELVTGKNTATADGYTYVPNYINKKLETENTAFVLAGDGGSYVKNAENAVVSAFRPYIVVAGSATTRGTEPKENVERVVFDNDSPQILLPKDDRSKNLNDGTMDIYAKRNKVVVESNLRYVTDVRIVNVAGMTLSSFSIEPGETIETRVETSGVYIVYADNGKYVKKVIVK